MLLEPFLLSLIAVSGSILVYKQLPRSIRRIIRSYGEIFAGSVMIIIWYYCGRNLVALVAGLMTSIQLNGLIYVANHPDEFLFLYDLRDMVRGEMKFAVDEVRRVAKEYKQGTKKPGYLLYQIIPQSSS